MDDLEARLEQAEAPELRRLASERTASRLPKNTSSFGYVSSFIVGSGGLRLLGLSGYSSNASAQFILVFDANEVPADGTVAPIVIRVNATSSFGYDSGTESEFAWRGRVFDRGIVICTSSTAPSLTIGSADTSFDVQYV